MRDNMYHSGAIRKNAPVIDDGGRRSGLSDASSFMPVAVDSALRRPMLNDLQAGKRLKETYEYAPKWHLTSAPGFEN